jgi:hypothetical protein
MVGATKRVRKMQRELVREHVPGGPIILTALAAVSVIGLTVSIYKMNVPSKGAQPASPRTVKPFFRRS